MGADATNPPRSSGRGGLVVPHVRSGHPRSSLELSALGTLAWLPRSVMLPPAFVPARQLLVRGWGRYPPI
jgi:hypothetical protein